MSKSKTKVFGPHLMLDLYDCDKTVLNDLPRLYAFLEELPERLGMHMLSKPYIVHAPSNDKDDPGGWSGFVIIQESHMSIHTFPEKKFLTADVYSCKPFDTEAVIEHFKDVFKTDDVETFKQDRGLRYPM